jgi:hypothetical protein
VTDNRHLRGALLAFVVVAAILLGCLTAGTPVAGDDSVAARTAGINLSISVRTVGTTAATIASTRTATLTTRVTAVLLATHFLLLVLWLGAPLIAAVPRQNQSRRGPPALA